ncbi:Uncharacterised protein [Klebsiella pneumoniae]|nr:Uncharacterised protein [Klebsiella pneumoniae]
MTHKYINFMGLDFNKVAEMKKSFTGFEKRIQINNDNFDDELFYFAVLWITFLSAMTTYLSLLIINFAFLWMLTCIHSCISKKTSQGRT